MLIAHTHIDRVMKAHRMKAGLKFFIDTLPLNGKPRVRFLLEWGTVSHSVHTSDFTHTKRSLWMSRTGVGRQCAFHSGVPTSNGVVRADQSNDVERGWCLSIRTKDYETCGVINTA